MGSALPSFLLRRNDQLRSKKFLIEALAPIGFQRIMLAYAFSFTNPAICRLCVFDSATAGRFYAGRGHAHLRHYCCFVVYPPDLDIFSTGRCRR
jgi:hypothetical protein